MGLRRQHRILRIGFALLTMVLVVTVAAAVDATRSRGSATVAPSTTTTAPTPSTTTTTTEAPPPSTTTTSAPPPRPTPPPAPTLSVRELQRRLNELGYWNSQTAGTLEQALLAFQKVERLPRTGQADAATLAQLAAAVRPTPASKAGDVIEIDKARQVIFVVRGGAVRWTINTSTGTEKRYRVDGGGWAVADTPEGRWTVTRAIDGNRRAALGTLYRPRYFHQDGIAIHGASEIPAQPASHGCARVSRAAMDFIWAAGLAPIGSTVWVYQGRA